MSDPNRCGRVNGKTAQVIDIKPSQSPIVIWLDRSLAERSDSWTSALKLIRKVVERLEPERPTALIELGRAAGARAIVLVKPEEVLEQLRVLEDLEATREEKVKVAGKKVPFARYLAEVIRDGDTLEGAIMLLVTDSGLNAGASELERAASDRGVVMSAAVLKDDRGWYTGYSESDLRSVVERSGGASLLIRPGAGGKFDIENDSRTTRARGGIHPTPRGFENRPEFEHHAYSIREQVNGFTAQMTSYMKIRLRDLPTRATLKIDVPGKGEVLIRHPRRGPQCRDAG